VRELPALAAYLAPVVLLFKSVDLPKLLQAGKAKNPGFTQNE